jgi:hypothetical protein
MPTTWSQPNRECVGVAPMQQADNTIGADPTITTLAPPTGSAAGGAISITVTGTNFWPGSVVEIDQVAQPTTYVSATSLTTSYDPTTAGTRTFTVRNPNDEESNSVSFVVGAVATADEEPQQQQQEPSKRGK